MCCGVNITIWMDPLAEEYQTSWETITNMLDKDARGAVSRRPLSSRRTWRFTTRRSITVTSAGLCFMVGPGCVGGGGGGAGGCRGNMVRGDFLLFARHICGA